MMRASETATSLTAHIAVISSHPKPAKEQIARYMPGLNGLGWSWIAAGHKRSAGAYVDAEGAPTVCDAGSIGLLAGRHKALEISRDADVLILLDDDVTIPPGWADKILEPFADPDVHFVGCRYLPDYAHAPPDWLEALWVEQEDGFRILGGLSLLDGGPVSRPYSPMLVWGLCFAVRRDTVLRLGGFHPDGYPWPLRRYRGDGESGLAAKAGALGLTAFYQADTHVMHAVPAERMEPRYFIHRSYLEGISNSYTDIRKARGARARPPRSWREIVRPVTTRIADAVDLRTFGEAGLRRAMWRAHERGRRYHEVAVRSDPALLEWVLRDDYGTGKLPDSTSTPLEAERRGREAKG